jgi:hypothetical protein
MVDDMMVFKATSVMVMMMVDTTTIVFASVDRIFTMLFKTQMLVNPCRLREF